MEEQPLLDTLIAVSTGRLRPHETYRAIRAAETEQDERTEAT